MPVPDVDQRIRDILDRRFRVGIIGLGYVGLPLARAFAAAGFPVLGFDTDPQKVERLRNGESYIGHIRPRPSARCSRPASSPPTASTASARPMRSSSACPRPSPRPASPISSTSSPPPARSPGASAPASSSSSRARPTQHHLRRPRADPRSERRLSPLHAGVDFHVAFSPDREDPGNPRFSAHTIPKVVGGLDADSRRLAAELYAAVVVRVVPVSSPEVAEATKILENTYRAVNIALVNELKLLFDRMGLDVSEVIAAASTKPFGFQAFYPGPGLGGHCIPIDPFYLTWIARKHGMSTRFIELAGEINTAMTHYVITRLADVLNDRSRPVRGSRVCLLGVAYKKDVDDIRESPALELMKILLEKGARVTYNDPHVPRLPTTRRHPSLLLESQPITPDFLAAQGAIVTDHSAYDWDAIAAHAPLILDTRNATRSVAGTCAHIIRA